MRLTPDTLPAIQSALRDADIDGWLLYDFRGINPIAGELLGLEGMLSRRIFVWVPRDGAPAAVTHAIEQGPWGRWPAGWRKEVYSSWRALEAALGERVAGKRAAMEYSPGDAVPYVDRVPAGVVEMVRALGAEVVSSGELISRFFAVWTPAQLDSHRRAAEVVREVALGAFAEAGARLGTGGGVREHELQAWVEGAFARAGFEPPDHGPIVAAGENAANPHYAPTAAAPRAVGAGDVLLIDLWGRYPGGVYADQTWMGVVGAPGARAVAVWETVRDARDAAVALLAERLTAGAPVRGAEADDAARHVVAGRGFGEFFIHRTGHSIDPRELHGAGPHLDNLETREERRIVEGVGFSVEPGVYLAGEFGMRSEVNAYAGDGELIVTPREVQRDLIVL